MSPPALRRMQELTIIAQDPSVKFDRKILTAQVSVPAEELAPGPRGYRVQVIDYDSSTGVLYPPLEYRILENGAYNDPFQGESDETLLNDPKFHAQNVYAIIMRTLARFESALGRRVGWSFSGHQLQVAPHAFADANAFYSKDDRALLFGYFPKSHDEEQEEDELPEEAEGNGSHPQQPEMVFTCLSHDVIVHETTHAILDGLRRRYTDPSSPEQGGFHEGFADIVALLSIFSLPSVVERVIDKNFIVEPSQPREVVSGAPELIDVKSLTLKELRDSLLMGLAEEVGQEIAEADKEDEEDKEDEIAEARKGALRRSVKLTPDKYRKKIDEFKESHRRGEVLVAAVMNAFLHVWVNRLSSLGSRNAGDGRAKSKEVRSTSPQTDEQAQPVARDDGQEGQTDKPAASNNQPSGYLNRARVVEEGAGVADYLLTMVIRALDYSPPTDLEFCDFLSAMLTADHEIRPDDSKYQFRKTLRESFGEYDITPTSKVSSPEPGIWEPPECALRYDRIRLDSMLRDPDEMFRFIWENRKELGIEEDAYTRVLDGVLNNTSIILLFEVGGRKLLFPGDAQIENWNYALKQAKTNPKLKQLLADVDVYKVGHHGSRNANPKSIWEGFKKKKSNKPGSGALRTFMSTKAGKHPGGHNAKDPYTEVPRESLVEALKKESNHFSTQMINPEQPPFRKFDIPLESVLGQRRITTRGGGSKG